MKHYPWHLAVVTGAASGIGRQFCIQLATKGINLIMVDRAPVDATIAALPNPVAVHSIMVDLTAPDAVDTIMTYILDHDLRPDLLINNAGIFDFASVTALTPERINLYIDLHMRAVTQLSRAMALEMRETGGGNILNMSSMSCWMPMPGIALYAATKAYIRVFSRALRVELKGSGVGVTVACPGGIATDLFGLPSRLQRLGVALGALATPETFVRRALAHTAHGRKQYINGLINRIAIVAVAALPEWGRRLIKTQLLTRYGRTC